MALLATCWLMVEFFIIPQGFIKWFYLSFYIHPFFLFFFQIFLWLKDFLTWVLLLFCFLTKITLYLSGLIFGPVCKKAVFFLVSFRKTRSSSNEQFHDSVEQCEVIIPHASARNCASAVSCPVKIFRNLDTLKNVGQIDEVNSLRNSWLNEYLNSSPSFTCDSDTLSDRSLSSASGYSTVLSSIADSKDDTNVSPTAPFYIDQDFSFDHENDEFEFTNARLEPSVIISGFSTCDPEFLEDKRDSPVSNASSSLDDDHNSLVHREALPMFCESNSPVFESDHQILTRNEPKLTDSFHLKYTESLRFFDLLYQERSFGMNAILMSPISVINTEMARESLAKSLTSDLELVHVGELCLMWEALHYRYRKVESFAFSENFQDQFFDARISGEFQSFQISLERLMEEEKIQAKSRNMSYMQRRYLPKVPGVTGPNEEMNIKSGGELIRAVELMKAIEKCVNAFWFYIKKDENEKSKWKFKAISRSCPQVEDPKDLNLLYYLTKTLRKKGLWLKELQGKKSWRLRRKMKKLGWVESEKIDVMFSTIDLELVEKVLTMTIISTNHLKWCQEKLDHLEFKEGKILRGTSTYLFPCS